jgi:hypothetical protein
MATTTRPFLLAPFDTRSIVTGISFGATLGIEERTVKAHVAKLLRKWECRTASRFLYMPLRIRWFPRQSKTDATEQIQHSESV